MGSPISTMWRIGIGRPPLGWQFRSNPIHAIPSQHANDQSYAPKDWIDEQETTDFR